MRGLRVLLVGVVVVGCASPERPEAPEVGALAGMRDAADAAERAFRVPADLTLAVAYAETRWRIPDDEAHDGAHEGHAPRAVGVGGLRPWLTPDPVTTAERLTGLSRDSIATEPDAGVLATAAVLFDLAMRRHGDVPPTGEPGAWLEVLGDYSGLEDADSRRSYAEDVYGWLEAGVRTIAADGEVVTLASRTIALPEGIAGRRAYSGAEYPGARWVAASSTNYTSGRGGNSVRYIVIHTMQGSYAGSISWFQNPSANASAHYNIRSSDGEITQMVHESDTGWHAGNWSYNQQSIGIEHEGYVSDPGRWYTDAMYRSSAALTRHLCDKYGIPIDRGHIIGHVEVPGATHTDPGTGWDWDRYMALVRGEPPRPDYDAEFVGTDHPAEMISGERAVAWAEMRNTGGRTWDLSNTWLGTTGPRDHASPFHDTENWRNDHRATAPDHSTYGTGTVGRFSFMITAPEVTEETVITDTFGLVQEGVTWFGPEDVTISIRVRPRTPPTPDEPPPTDDGATDPPDADDGAGDDVTPPPVDGDASHDPIPADSTLDRPEVDMLSGSCSAGGAGARGGAWVLVLLALAGLARRRRR